jgi:predicted NACHT family NTPase
MRLKSSPIRMCSIATLLVQWTEKERDIKLPAEWVTARLSRGKCLVMLDGLEEVGDPEARKITARWVERQMSRFASCPFILTSRPHGYRTNPLTGVHVLEVRGFSAEQVDRFVNNWYLSNETKAQGRLDEGVKRDARIGARELLGRLASAPALNDLTVNPLLLTMIATVHRYRSSLPGRRVELYAEIAEVYLGKRQQSKGLPLDLTPAQKQRVLQALAWTMMQRKVRDIGAADAAKAIRETLAAVDPKIENARYTRGAPKPFAGARRETGRLYQRRGSGNGSRAASAIRRGNSQEASQQPHQAR